MFEVQVDRQSLDASIRRILERIGDEIIEEAQHNIAQQDLIETGYLLSDSFEKRWDDVDGSLLVGSKASYAAYVEYGARPHFPPILPILRWVEKVKGEYGTAAKKSAYAIANHIARYGQKATFFFRDAVLKVVARYGRS